MNKRIVSLILCIVMIMSALMLTGCGEEEEETITVTRAAMTLSLWLPAAEGSEIDDEAVVNVENAINAITQQKFKTAIKLKVFPADEYDSLVLSKIYQIKDEQDKADAKARAERQARRDAKKNANKNADETAQDTGSETVEAVAEETAAETVDETAAEEESAASQYILPVDENGKRPYDYEYENAFLNSSVFASYPGVESDQFDIFLVHGFDEFKLLYDDMLLSDLSSNVALESKELSSYINSNFFKGAVYDGSLSVIPNNRVAGTMEVMLINKEVCEKLSYDPEKFTRVESLLDYEGTGVSFIEDVVKNLPDVTPVAGQFTIPNIKYIGKDDQDVFSLIAAPADIGVTNYETFSMKSVFETTAFVNNYKFYKRVNAIAKPADINKVDKFAVGFVTGTYYDIQKYMDDYEVVALQYPQLSRDEVYKSCYAVSSNTKDLNRAMEIVTAINTDTNLRTILQYGCEGIHWRYDIEDDSIITKLSDKYKMDMSETGNAFVTYPDYGVPMSEWDGAKSINTYLYLPYTYGFTCLNEKTSELLDKLSAKSRELYAKIEAMSYEDFNSKLSEIQKEVNDLECFWRLNCKFGNDPAFDEKNEIDVEQCLPDLFLEYVNERGW
ncbi:MAG: hypothetical protein IKN38_01090 [Clostridia bacterium]|nr:hypothetical protein [Clostridia bacterium]